MKKIWRIKFGTSLRDMWFMFLMMIMKGRKYVEAVEINWDAAISLNFKFLYKLIYNHDFFGNLEKMIMTVIAILILMTKTIKLYRLLCKKDEETPYFSLSYGNFSYWEYKESTISSV